MNEAAGSRWLLLIHEIPPRPSYLRVKIGRRLRALGAVAVKSSVYVLPRSEQAREDFQWVRQEVVAGRGDASVCEARFVEGLSDAAVEARFDAARNADYEALAREVRRLQATLKRGGGRAASAAAVPVLARLTKRRVEIASLDFFGASGGPALDRLLADVERGLKPAAAGADLPASLALRDFRGRTWVTRRGVRVDRMASAWLIRRFIDPDARFAFVGASGYERAPGDVRFDMFEAEFTHEGPLCTFEVLKQRFGLQDPALGHLAEIVHDVDLKDSRFARPEAAGVDRLVTGITLRHADDQARLREGDSLFESLYESFRKKG
jgi:hypothetical protein